MTGRLPPAPAVPVDRSLRLDHRAWMALAEAEHALLMELLTSLDAEDWSRRTDCAEWDVREVVAHLVGAAESTASVRELLRQQRRGRRLRPGAPAIDGINAAQVDERSACTPEDLLAALPDAARRGLRARRRLPAPLRAVRVPFGPPLGVRSLGYLMDRIYTRDAWLHRVDVARATGRRLALSPEHDGRIVADVVEEWARAHGRSVDLHLTGPAGGRYTCGGGGGQELELDAVELCRVLSGRGTGQGLLATPVPF